VSTKTPVDAMAHQFASTHQHGECSNMSNLVNRARSRKFLPQDQLVYFPPYLTAKLGNIDSRNLTCAVAHATLNRWEIPHTNGMAYVRRSEARNFRRAWFGPKGTRIRPPGEGTMVFELFDGFLHPTSGRASSGRGGDAARHQFINTSQTISG
jgi:hypothetical protein